MSIRVATEADLNRILEIEGLSFQTPWDYNKFKTALTDLFLVFEDQDILGFLSCCRCAVASRAIIMKIAVHPDHRGRGVASRLLEAVLDQLNMVKIKEVELHVDIVKTGAIKLYERFGFRIRKVLTADYEEEEAFYEMRLRFTNE